MAYKYLLLCVIYKKSAEMSTTLNSLVNLDVSHKENILVIWHNDACVNLDTNTLLFNRLSEKFKNIDVINHRTNQTLATLYNKIYEQYSQSVDAFCILDDDSILSPNYLTACLVRLNLSSAALYLPRVYHGDTLISPTRFDGHRYDSIETGIVPAKKIRAIASGMVIPKNTFNRFKFDERFIFYGADTEYILRLAKNNASIGIIDTKIQHALSTDALNNKPFPNFKYASLLQSFALIGVLYNKKYKSLYKIMRLSLRQAIYSKKLPPLIDGVRMFIKVVNGRL